MEWLWIIIGLLLTCAGIAGSVLPVLPGPPLNYLALVVVHFSGVHQFSYRFLTVWLVITFIVAILDYLIPIYGARLSGGGKKGIWGATIGLFFGLIFFPPFGMILWSFAGAVVGEMWDGKSMSFALKAGTGTFIGFIAGTMVKLVVSLIMAFYLIRAVI